jgi:hypothetical protein
VLETCEQSFIPKKTRINGLGPRHPHLVSTPPALGIEAGNGRWAIFLSTQVGLNECIPHCLLSAGLTCDSSDQNNWRMRTTPTDSASRLGDARRLLPPPR